MLYSSLKLTSHQKKIITVLKQSILTQKRLSSIHGGSLADVHEIIKTLQ